MCGDGDGDGDGDGNWDGDSDSDGEDTGNCASEEEGGGSIRNMDFSVLKKTIVE